MKRTLCLLCALCLLGLPAPAGGETDAPANWYEVFVRSYQDSDGDGVGDLNGLRQRLDYIADMGFDGLWLMPVMKSPSYHKYDVTDYFAVDEEYGTLADFRALAQDCHARGISLIVDLPLNHTSVDHPWFQAAAAALQSGEQENPYADYYCFSRQPGAKKVSLSGTDWYYEEQFSGGGMPDLNLENPAVLAEIREILSFWLLECGVDGFRLDAVTSYFAGSVEKNVAFLRQIKQMTREMKPGSYLVGEAWTGLSDIAAYYASGVDSFFLFPASQAEGYIARALRSRKPAAAYADSLSRVEAALPPGAVWAPFLSNHDTGRAVAAFQARKTPDKLKFAHGALAMMGGNTFTYYGEEIGMAGAGEDPNKRTAMYWNDGDMTRQPPGVTKAEYPYPCVDEQQKDPDSLLCYIRALNRLKQAYPAIARGDGETVYQDDFLCLLRRGEQYVALNFSASKTLEMVLPAGLAAPAIGGELAVGRAKARLERKTGGAVLTLPPYAIVLIVNP